MGPPDDHIAYIYIFHTGKTCYIAFRCVGRTPMFFFLGFFPESRGSLSCNGLDIEQAW